MLDKNVQVKKKATLYLKMFVSTDLMSTYFKKIQLFCQLNKQKPYTYAVHHKTIAITPFRPFTVEGGQRLENIKKMQKLQFTFHRVINI